MIFAILTVKAQTTIIPTNLIVLDRLISCSNTVLVTNAEFRCRLGDRLFFKNEVGCPVRHFGVGGRQIRPGNLQVQYRLPVRLVLGMEQRQRLGFVLGAQGMLFAGGGVLGVKDPGSPKQDEFRFHDNYPNHETSPVSCAFMNASFGEFQRILASSGE
jgi:hypothetical protein